MNTVSTQEIVPIALEAIEVGERLREVDPDYVVLIAASMRERGLDSPIHVTEPDGEGRRLLIAGAHRLAAAHELRWSHIGAIVFTGGALQRQLLEVDENLMRRDLTPLDRAVFIAKRKEIYLSLHPLTAKGKNAAKNERNFFRLIDVAFAADTAKRLQISRRSIELAVRRAGLPPELRTAIARTPFAKRAANLDVLVRLAPDVQHGIGELLASNGWVRGDTIRMLIERVTGQKAALKGPDQRAADLYRQFLKLDPQGRGTFMRLVRGTKP